MAMREPIREAETAEYEKACIRKDGIRIPVHLDVFRIDNDAGMPIGLDAIIDER